MTILPFAATQPFDAATCHAMGVAFETAWQKVLVSGKGLASSTYADATREALALSTLPKLA